MENEYEIINAFTHWLYNADPNFIAKAWHGNDIMIDHFEAKLRGLIRLQKEHYMSTDVLVKFHQELTKTHKIILYEYIMLNHKNKWS
jgi:hypothetical protein